MHPWRYYAFYGALMALLFVAGFVFIVGERFAQEREYFNSKLGLLQFLDRLCPLARI